MSNSRAIYVEDIEKSFLLPSVRTEGLNVYAYLADDLIKNRSDVVFLSELKKCSEIPGFFDRDASYKIRMLLNHAFSDGFYNGIVVYGDTLDSQLKHVVAEHSFLI